MGRVGDGLKADNANWSFSVGVAANFDDHVSKSVPLYHEGHQLICGLSDFFVKSDSVVYEVGCSTGTLILKLAQHNAAKKGARFVGIDLESEMIAVANGKRDAAKVADLTFVVDDALTADFEPADMICCYYTVQFVRPSKRQELIDKFYKSLRWGGALCLFEKVRGPDARFQDIVTAMYHDWKMEQGYDATEIVAKARSLKGVLEPFSTQGNTDMLRRAGFQDIMTIMKYVCFEGFVAIK